MPHAPHRQRNHGTTATSVLPRSDLWAADTLPIPGLVHLSADTASRHDDTHASTVAQRLNTYRTPSTLQNGTTQSPPLSPTPAPSAAPSETLALVRGLRSSQLSLSLAMKVAVAAKAAGSFTPAAARDVADHAAAVKSTPRAWPRTSTRHPDVAPVLGFLLRPPGHRPGYRFPVVHRTRVRNTVRSGRRQRGFHRHGCRARGGRVRKSGHCSRLGALGRLGLRTLHVHGGPRKGIFAGAGENSWAQVARTGRR